MTLKNISHIRRILSLPGGPTTPSVLPQAIITPSIATLAANITLDRAYTWICTQREAYSHANSIWDLRTHTINNELISSWEAIDALVLKALTLTLPPLFSTKHYSHCTPLKGAGGIHAAIKGVSQHQANYKHLLKSDAYHYYESIDHQVLLTALKKQVDCKHLVHLVAQYCQRLEVREGNYYHFTSGIPKGCPLSPLMAALYLKPLDDEMKKHGFYVRFMDDWVIMVKTKRQLRKVIKLTHKILDSLKLKMHPDKTFLGCIKKGFDFLGIHFSDNP